MAQIAVAAAIGAGFGLIRRRPLAVLAWGGVAAIMHALAVVLIGPMYLGLISAVFHAAQSRSGPPDFSAFAPQAAQLQGLIQLLNLANLLVGATIYCAVFRAVLHPERSTFAYLRLGAPELFAAALIFGLGVAVVVALVIVMIPVAFLIGITVAATHAGAAALVLLPIIMLAAFVGAAVIALRFAFVGPMIVDDGKFHLMESWELTRGRVGSLFLVGLGLFGLALLLETVLLAILVGVGAAALAAVAGGLQNVPALLQRPPQELLADAAPFLGLYVLLVIPVSGCFFAIFGAPWARAYRDLKPDASEAFA